MRLLDRIKLRLGLIPCGICQLEQDDEMVQVSRVYLEQVLRQLRELGDRTGRLIEQMAEAPTLAEQYDGLGEMLDATGLDDAGEQ